MVEFDRKTKRRFALRIKLNVKKKQEERKDRVKEGKKEKDISKGKGSGIIVFQFLIDKDSSQREAKPIPAFLLVFEPS